MSQAWRGAEESQTENRSGLHDDRYENENRLKIVAVSQMMKLTTVQRKILPMGDDDTPAISCPCIARLLMMARQRERER